MKNSIKPAAAITVGTFVFTAACISIGGIVSGGGANLPAAVAIAIITTMTIGVGIAFGRLEK